MKRASAILALIMIQAAFSFAGPVDPASLLTPAEVAQACGLSGLKAVPRNSKKGAGGDINIADSGGKLILILNLLDKDSAESAKKDFNEAKAMKGFCKAEEKALGDEAFSGPTNAPQYMIYVRKGAFAFSVATFMTPLDDTPTALSMEQLRRLAAIVAEKL
jgi:hypothetical protein